MESQTAHFLNLCYDGEVPDPDSLRIDHEEAIEVRESLERNGWIRTETRYNPGQFPGSQYSNPTYTFIFVSPDERVRVRLIKGKIGFSYCGWIHSNYTGE